MPTPTPPEPVEPAEPADADAGHVPLDLLDLYEALEYARAVDDEIYR